MSRLRLRRGNWSVQELERLRLLLPNRGVEQTALLLRRSADSVLRKALDLLRVPTRKGAWTESDDWQLRQAWGAVELRLLAPMLGRPTSEVRRRASQLRQRFVEGQWTRTELRLLKKLYGTRTDADLEVSLMRSRTEIAVAAKGLCLAKDKRFQAAQVSSARARQGAALAAALVAQSDGNSSSKRPGNTGKRSSMPRWTPDEVEQLRKLYPDQDNLAVARALGRSVTSVANKAYQLGIHKTAALLTSIGRSNIAFRYASDDAATRPNERFAENGDSAAATRESGQTQLPPGPIPPEAPLVPAVDSSKSRIDNTLDRAAATGQQSSADGD